MDMMPTGIEVADLADDHWKTEPRDPATGRWVLYHGTSLKLAPGTLIKPAHETGLKSFYADIGNPGEVEGYTHATTDMGNAADYAKADRKLRGSGHVHVYRVTLTGEGEPDPGDNQGVRSRQYMRVEHEISPARWQIAHRKYLKSVTESRADYVTETSNTSMLSTDLACPNCGCGGTP